MARRREKGARRSESQRSSTCDDPPVLGGRADRTKEEECARSVQIQEVRAAVKTTDGTGLRTSRVGTTAQDACIATRERCVLKQSQPWCRHGSEKRNRLRMQFVLMRSSGCGVGLCFTAASVCASLIEHVWFDGVVRININWNYRKSWSRSSH
jgi:hypothetical protein